MMDHLDAAEDGSGDKRDQKNARPVHMQSRISAVHVRHAVEQTTCVPRSRDTLNGARAGTGKWD